MGKPAARIGDMHTCPVIDPGPKPHTGGPIIGPGVKQVLIGGLPAATAGDQATCAGAPDAIKEGAKTVLIGNKPAARMGDATTHGGVIVKGEPTVMIGDGGGKASGLTAVFLGAARVGRPFCASCSAAAEENNTDGRHEQ